MKKLLLLTPVLVLCAAYSFAQTSIEFIPSAGYTFGDRSDFRQDYAKINGALNLGGSLLFNVNRRFGIELMYNHIGTNSGIYNYGYIDQGAQISNGNLSLDYIMAGPVQSFNIPGSPVHPFLGAMLGAAVFTPGVYGYSDDVKFAWGLQFGTNIYFTPRFGLRLKAQLLAPADASDGGFYAGSDATHTPVSAYADVYQFSLNAGLVIGLGRVLPPLRPVQNMRRRPGYRRRYAPYPY
jgi:hypothetical protein